MEIEVFVPSLLRDSTRQQAHFMVKGDTLAAALRQLFLDYPLLRTHLYDESGRLRPHVLLYYNQENIGWLDSLDIPLRRGDCLHVVQAVSGG